MLDRLRQKMARALMPAPEAIEAKAADEADFAWDESRGWTLLTGQRQDSPRSFENLVLEGFRKNAVVSACTRQVVTSLSEARIATFRPDPDGELVEIPDAPSTELMAHPNPRDSGVEFIERSAAHYLIGGNTYWWKRRLGSGRVERMLPIRPDRVFSAITDRDDIPLAYKVLGTFKQGTPDDPRQGGAVQSGTVGGQTAQVEIVPAGDIVHIPDLDPLNEVFGVPRLLAASLELRTDNLASDYVAEILGNHGAPGFLVAVDKDASDKSLERAEERWTERWGPDRGRGKISFVRGGTVFKEIGFSLKDLEFPNLRLIARESICSVFGVDPRVIAIGSAAKDAGLSGVQFKIALEMLWSQTLIPLIRRWEAAMNAFLAPEFGDVVMKFVLDDVKALEPDRDADVKRAKDMLAAGVYTDREIRAETGHDPEPEEGLVLRPVNVVALPAGQTGSANGSQAQPADEGSGAGMACTTYVLGDGATPERRRQAWKAFDAFARQQQPLFEREATEQLRIERDQLVRVIRAVLQEESGGLTDLGPVVADEVKVITPDSLRAFRQRLGALFGGYHADWVRRFERVTRETVSLVGVQVSADLGIAFDVANPEVARFITRLANNLADDVTEATFDAVRATFAEGVRAGEGTAALAGRVDAVFGQGLVREGVRLLSAEQRATLIARTMSTASANGGAVWTVRAARVQVDKSWTTQGDDRVRTEHNDMEGETVGRDDVFTNGLDFPSEPNCRCTVIFVRVRRRAAAETVTIDVELLWDELLETMQRMRRWTRGAAERWLTNHDFKTGTYEKTKNFHAFRQRPKGGFVRFAVRSNMFGFKPSDGVRVTLGIRSDGKSEVQSIKFFHGQGGES